MPLIVRGQFLFLWLGFAACSCSVDHKEHAALMLQQESQPPAEKQTEIKQSVSTSAALSLTHHSSSWESAKTKAKPQAREDGETTDDLQTFRKLAKKVFNDSYVENKDARFSSFLRAVDHALELGRQQAANLQKNKDYQALLAFEEGPLGSLRSCESHLNKYTARHAQLAEDMEHDMDNLSENSTSMEERLQTYRERIRQLEETIDVFWQEVDPQAASFLAQQHNEMMEAKQTTEEILAELSHAVNLFNRKI